MINNSFFNRSISVKNYKLTVLINCLYKISVLITNMKLKQLQFDLLLEFLDYLLDPEEENECKHLTNTTPAVIVTKSLGVNVK